MLTKQRRGEAQIGEKVGSVDTDLGKGSGIRQGDADVRRAQPFGVMQLNDALQRLMQCRLQLQFAQSQRQCRATVQGSQRHHSQCYPALKVHINLPWLEMRSIRPQQEVGHREPQQYAAFRPLLWHYFSCMRIDRLDYRQIYEI